MLDKQNAVGFRLISLLVFELERLQASKYEKFGIQYGRRCHGNGTRHMLFI